MNYDDFVRKASHAEVLISQGKYSQAENILKGLMATGVERQDIWRMMIVTWIGLGDYSSARDLCKMSIHHYPHDAWALYSLANISLAERQYDEALQYIEDALKMEPESDTFHTLKSTIYLRIKEYPKALDAALTALELDPENVDALNNRSNALMALGRKEEAFVNLKYTLATNPENPETHANMGWSLLQVGQEKEALKHFKESLQKNPIDAYALAGMQEALKSRFPIYRFFLMSALKLERLKTRQQWGFILISYLVYRTLVYLAKRYEFLQLWVLPVIVLIVLFFLSSWILSPLMNLYLMTNAYGKWTLSKPQKESARFTGIALGISGIALFLYFFILTNEGLLQLALVSFVLMIPLGSMNNPILESNKKKLRFFAIALVALGLGSTLLSIIENAFIHLSLAPFLVSYFVYQWYANYLIIKEE